MRKIAMMLTVLFLSSSVALAAAPAQAIWSYSQEVQKVADPLTEDTLARLNAEDYAGFSGHFDAKLKAGLKEDGFKRLLGEVKGKYGNYISKEMLAAELQPDCIIVSYKGKFSANSEPLLIQTVLVQENGATVIGGFWLRPMKPVAQ